MQLMLTDKEAQELIDLLKATVTSCNKHLNYGDKGSVSVESHDADMHPFKIEYMYALDDIHIQFYDCITNHTLVRINLDSRFHNNSDGKVRGHRVEIFSEEEFVAKADGFTHYKAFALPYQSFQDTNDFLTAMRELFSYANIQKGSNLNFVIGPNLL